MRIVFGSDIAFECDKDFERIDIKNTVEAIKPVFNAADFRMVNLENVFYEKEEGAIIKSGPSLRSSKKGVDFLNELNIDVVGLANNHFGDYGAAGMEATVRCLKANKIEYIGAGENISRAYDPYVFSKDGITVSVIAACENEFGIADGKNAGSAGYDLERLNAAILQAKAHYDYAVVFFHGGNENNPFPSPHKRALYRHWTDLGADAVVAMHTHCPQGYEIYNGKPIIYSMGNFFFPTLGEKSNYPDSHYSWYYGYLTELEFTADNTSLKIHPYRFYSVDDPIILLSGNEKESFMQYLAEICKPISDLNELTRLFKIWCTMAGVSYAPMVDFKSEMLDNGSDLSKHLRNIFSCEAHNELIRTLMEMCYNEEVGEYITHQDEIKSRQKIASV